MGMVEKDDGVSNSRSKVRVARGEGLHEKHTSWIPARVVEVVIESSIDRGANREDRLRRRGKTGQSELAEGDLKS